MMNKAISYIYAKTANLRQYTSNQKGAQAIEYVGVVAVAVVLIVALISMFGGEKSDIAQALVDKVTEAIGKINMGG